MAGRVDGLLRSISAEVEYLPDLEEGWGEMDDNQRIAASYDWDLVVMGDLLVGLERRHQAGELSEEQEERYVELKAELKAALPSVERLGLRSSREVLDG